MQKVKTFCPNCHHPHAGFGKTHALAHEDAVRRVRQCRRHESHDSRMPQEGER